MALAYNCIGVNFQKMGEGNPTMLRKAITYHEKHKDIADTQGKFMAHSNLGMIFDKLGEGDKAQLNH